MQKRKFFAIRSWETNYVKNARFVRGGAFGCCHHSHACHLVAEAFSDISIKSRSSHPEVLLVKGVLKICAKFTGEPSCRSVISIKLNKAFRLID